MATSGKAIEFQDVNGTTVTVPTDNVEHYVGVKVEQLTVLTQLMVDATTGNAIETSEKDLSILALMIHELARTVEDLLDKVSISAKKGGTQ